MWFKPKTRRLTVDRPHGPARRWAHGAHGLVRRVVRVTAVARETDDAVTVTVEADDGKPILFRAGQYLTHVFDVDGEPLRRAYSMSCREGGQASFTAKAVAGGRISAHLLSRIKPGDRHSVLGPSGEFLLADGDHRLLFVAGGSGITPVVSLIETALAQSPLRPVRLVYASRTQADIIFRERIAALAQTHPRFSVIHVLSNPGEGWGGERGRLDAGRVCALLQPGPGDEVYLCGPAGLMDSAAAGLASAGVPAARIHRERFLAAPRATQARPVEPQEIEFRVSGRRVTQRVGESILDAGLREGVDLSFSCTVGGCASCKVLVTGGRFALNEPNCLSTEERAAGYTLACSSFALEPLVVDA
jgi:ferredoxin-NADP reductase